MTSKHDFKSKAGLHRIINAWFYSLAGIRTAWRTEAAFRQELWLAVPMFIVALCSDVSAEARALMIASILLVLICELLNSAIEAIVDKTTPEVHELAARAKDMASAAVLISLLLCVSVWGIILLT